jgi:membrane peptidoglycan carboxypeptidase
VPSVKVLYLSGIQDSIKTAQNLGITTLTAPNRYGLSLVLGGGEVKLIDLVGAYSVFSQEGIKHRQAFILEVKDSQGKTLEKYLDSAAQVIEPQYAKLINNVLSDVEARSPLFQNSLNLTVFEGREVALKTGTTNDYRDAWAIGYTPTLAVGVWAGNNNNKPMQKQAGSILAAIPIWHDFLSKTLENQPVEFFNKPEPIQENRPMLNGEYIINNEVHNILYYLNQNDPQFQNWEAPIKVWWQKLPG